MAIMAITRRLNTEACCLQRPERPLHPEVNGPYSYGPCSWGLYSYAYIVMAWNGHCIPRYIPMGVYSYGLCTYGLYSSWPMQFGLYSYGLYIHCLERPLHPEVNGLYGYGLCSYGV